MRQKKSLICEELEPRLLFSAGLEGLLLDDHNIDSDTAIVETVTDSEAEVLLANSNQTSSTTSLAREVVFISEDIDDFDRLIADLAGQAHIDVYILDDAQDGIEQITSVLAGYQNLDAVHLVSHGSSDALQLGNGSLSSDNLSDYQNAIESWQSALNEQADLLLYGCDLASGAAGQTLVSGLQDLTGADVAASDDLTGQAALGGDWTLEYQRGEIETAVVFSNQIQSDWNGVLAAINLPSDQTTPQNSTLVFSSANGNAVSITDVAAGESIQVNLNVGNGTLTLNGTTGLTFVEGSNGSADGYMSITGTVEDINTAMDGMFFTTTEGVSGTSTLTVQIQGDTYPSDSILLTISGSDINESPVIDGTPATAATSGDSYSFIPNVTDDSSTLTYSIANKPSWAVFDSSTGELSGTPGLDDIGTTSGIVISVSDGYYTVALPDFDLTVAAGTPANDAPTAGDKTVSTSEDAAYTFTAADFNFSDVDGDSLASVQITSLESAGSLQLDGVDVTLNQIISKADIDTGKLSFIPASNANGSGYDNFGFSVNDGTTDSAATYSMTIDVSPDNDAPTIGGTATTDIAAGESYSFIPTVNDSDGDTLTYSTSNKPAWASFDTNTGALTGTPTDADAGTTNNIVIYVSDGTVTTSLAAFDLTVAASTPAEETTSPSIDPTVSASIPSEETALSDLDLTLFELEADTKIDALNTEATLADYINKGISDDTIGDEDDTTVESNTIEVTENVIADADYMLTIDDKLIVKLIDQTEDRALMPELTPELSGETAAQPVEHRHANNIPEDDGRSPDLPPPQLLNQNSFQFELKLALEELNRSLGVDGHAEQVGDNIIVTTTTGISIALTAGFINWALKGQSLAVAVMSAIPSWNVIDPSPVIGATNGLHATMDHTPSQQQKRLDSIFNW